jgi:hypothetical protein
MCMYKQPIFIGPGEIKIGRYEYKPYEYPTPIKEEQCKCCCGTGIQKNKDDLWVKCSGCNGTGKW